jgi:hypothetical protein
MTYSMPSWTMALRDRPANSNPQRTRRVLPSIGGNKPNLWRRTVNPVPDTGRLPCGLAGRRPEWRRHRKHAGCRCIHASRVRVIDGRQRLGTAPPFPPWRLRSGPRSSPIDQCSDMPPRTSRTLSMPSRCIGFHFFAAALPIGFRGFILEVPD